MTSRRRLSFATSLLALAGVVAGCSPPSRPSVRTAAAPASCDAAVAAAFPGGKPGTLPAYREVERRCPSLEELKLLKAFDPSILRFDCAPADILAIAGQIPDGNRRATSSPAELIGTAVCRQFNEECTDYDELRRDHAESARNPTMMNRGFFVHHQVLFEACTKKYG